MKEKQNLERILLAIRESQPDSSLSIEGWDAKYPEFEGLSCERMQFEFNLRLGEYLLFLGSQLKW